VPLLLFPLLLPEPSKPLFFPFPFSLPLPLHVPSLLVLGTRGGGASWGHGGSCYGGRGGSSCYGGRGIERGGLSLCRRVVQLDLLEFEVITDSVEGRE
jgi:hypothetical protein